MPFNNLLLGANNAKYSPPTIQGSWNDTAGAVTKELVPQQGTSGDITTVARAETSTSNTFKVLLYRGVSTPLAAQTISGTVDVIIGLLESNAAADFYWHIHIYVTQGDSDTPRGTLLSNYSENTTNEWPTTAAGHSLQSAQTMSSLAISAGDRIVVELGYIARNSSSTSRTGTLSYGTGYNANLLTVTGNDTIFPGYIAFSNAITEVGDIDTDVAQFPAEVFAGSYAPVDVAQFPAELFAGSYAPVDIAQFPAELFSGSYAPVDIAQLAIEIFSVLKGGGGAKKGGNKGKSGGGGVSTVLPGGAVYLQLGNIGLDVMIGN